MSTQLYVTYYSTEEDLQNGLGIPYIDNGASDVYLGEYNDFKGSCDGLINIVDELVNREGIFTDFIIVGNLGLILGHCPANCDYISITNK